MKNTKLYITVSVIAVVLLLVSSVLEVQLAGDFLFSFVVFFGLCGILSLFNVMPLKTVLFLSLTLTMVYVLWPFLYGAAMFFLSRFDIYSMRFTALAQRLVTLITAHVIGVFTVLLLKKERLKRAYITFMVIFALMYAFVLVTFDNNIHVSRYTIDSPYIKSDEKPITIAHISDLHCTVFPEKRDLESFLNDIKPDIIFLTGDIADDFEPFDGCAVTLEAIKDIAPVYYVTGNHEHWADDYDLIIEQIKSYGITHLSDTFEYADINGHNVLIAGMDDPDKHFSVSGEKAFTNRFKTLNSRIDGDFDGLKLLLSHRPELTDYYKNAPIDIVFSGHAHGGQVVIPFFLNGLYAPNQGGFPAYAGGVYTLDGGVKMVVSRGLSIGSLPRVFNPPELVILTIE